MTRFQRHRLVHLVAARGFDARTVAKVLDGVPMRPNIIHDRIRAALVELGFEFPNVPKEQKAA